MLAAATAAARRAHAPYSGIRVGAAVTGPGLDIHAGCNVENASYGLTQCAERNALAAALAAGVAAGTLTELVIFGQGFALLSPCGACRQVIAELMAKDAIVEAVDERGSYHRWRADELLPDPCVLDDRAGTENRG